VGLDELQGPLTADGVDNASDKRYPVIPLASVAMNELIGTVSDEYVDGIVKEEIAGLVVSEITDTTVAPPPPLPLVLTVGVVGREEPPPPPPPPLTLTTGVVGVIVTGVVPQDLPLIGLNNVVELQPVGKVDVVPQGLPVMILNSAPGAHSMGVEVLVLVPN
jgi:hypothetical protein